MIWIFDAHPIELCLTQFAQTSHISVQEVSQQLETLKSQVEILQNTNQILSDGLKSQVEFLKQENQALSNSFVNFVDAMKWNLIVLTSLAGVLTAVGGWIFKNNLEDAKKVAQEMINTQVERKISELVEVRVEEVARTFRREQVIGATKVDYYLPNMTQEPTEFKLLKARQFKDVRLVENLETISQSPRDVVVLDLQNWTLLTGQRFIEVPNEEKETHARQQIDGLLEILPTSAVLVVYIRGTIRHLYSIGDRYVLPANNPVTLVGNTADGAYVAAGDRRMSIV